MLKSLFGIVEDVVSIAVAPLEIAANVARAVTKPVAEVAKEVVADTKEMMDLEEDDE